MNDEIRQLTAIYDTIVEFFVTYSFQLVGALIIIILGFWLGNKVSKLVEGLCERKDLDVTLSKFIASCVKILIVTIMAIIALGKIGISIAPFVAALGAASLGVGLALQSPLSNYGAGLNLILTRPFVVGDTITVQGVTGIVQEIRLAYTRLTDEDDVEITIPNRHIIGEVIHNSQANTLIELGVGISYHADPENAIEIIRQSLSQLENSTRPPQVGIDNFGDSNINLGIRFWAPSHKHYQTRFAANSAIFSSLQQANIEIAYPQHEVRLLDIQQS